MLVDATWALVGNDSLSGVLAVLRPVVDEAIPELHSGMVTDTLPGAFAEHYRREKPGDAEVLERIGREVPRQCAGTLRRHRASGTPPGDQRAR